MQRIVHSLRLDIADSECDYRERSLWYRNVLVGSIARSQPSGVHILPGKVQGSWLAPGVFAEKASKSEKEVTDVWAYALAN